MCLTYLNCDRENERFMAQIIASRCHLYILLTITYHVGDVDFVGCCSKAAAVTFAASQKDDAVARGILDIWLSASVKVSKNPTVLGSMCSLLALFAMRDAAVSRKIIRHSFLGILISALNEHERHAVLCDLGCYLLCVLCTGGETNQNAIVDAGGIRVIVSICLLHPEHEAFGAACSALATLSTGKDSIKKRIIESGALVPVICALKSACARSNMASLFLCNLSSGGKKIADAMHEAGCVVPLIGLINVTSDAAGDARRNVCIVIGNMAERSEDAKIGFIAHGAVAALRVAVKSGNFLADRALTILEAAEK
jgi:hypothetical protein